MIGRTTKHSVAQSIRAAVAGVLILTLSGVAQAASHNDAPLISLDPSANITDVYAFITTGTGTSKVLNLIMAVNPLEEPGNGINYYRFSEDVLYSIHVERGIAGAEGKANFSGTPTISYNFRFKTQIANGNTAFAYGVGQETGVILNTGDPRQNLVQTYTVERVIEGEKLGTDLGVGQTLLVPPCNVGSKTTPRYYQSNGALIEGAKTNAELDVYTSQTIYSLADGTKVFCGQRDDGFYGDVAAIFDLISLRSPGVDTLKGYNTHVIALQVPLTFIVRDVDVPIIGVYASTSRPKVTVLSKSKTKKPRITDETERIISEASDVVISETSTGKGKKKKSPFTLERSFVQVQRMGNPLFNELLVAQKDKDLYNRLLPDQDALQFAKYASEPELAGLLNSVLLADFETTARQDLVDIFIPDILKLDTSTPAVPLAGQSTFHRLGLYGGDKVFSTFQGKQISSGWPNGRRPGDDVIDIALTAVASGPTNNPVLPTGDNVNANDHPYLQVFPYLGTPAGGPTSSLHD